MSHLSLRGGFDTCWKQSGSGPRQALMIHCSLAHQGAWNGVIDRLDRLGNFTTFDLPGHGKSADWDGRGEFQDVATAMARDFIAGPMDIIGHSFGATVALRLAMENPGLVRSLTLIEPVYFAATRGNPAFARHEREFAPFLQALQAGDMAGAAQAFIAVWGDGTPWEKIPEQQRLSAIKRIPLIAAHAGAIFEDPAGVLAPGRLEALDLPVLLLEGGRSPAIIAAIQGVLAARLPRVVRHVVAGASHMLPITHGAQVSEHIAKFWKNPPSD